MSKPNTCWICGRPRGLEKHRESWSMDCKTASVPRTGNPDDSPAQLHNDLIINASVWRNGGSNSETHICNDCLRVGVRAIKVAVSNALGELDAGHDKDAELSTLTERLAVLQLKHHNVCFDHDRMQDRLAKVIAELEEHGVVGADTLRVAKYEVRRGHAANNTPHRSGVAGGNHE